MASVKNAEDVRHVIFNWLSTYYTLDFLAVWEEVNNPNFNRVGFHTARNEPGRLLVSTKKWVEATSLFIITFPEISKSMRHMIANFDGDITISANFTSLR